MYARVRCVSNLFIDVFANAGLSTVDLHIVFKMPANVITCRENQIQR